MEGSKNKWIKYIVVVDEYDNIEAFLEITLQFSGKFLL